MLSSSPLLAAVSAESQAQTRRRILIAGGNTLNQQAIWKAQGIDIVLRKAWDQGIILGGASAGSLCWFEESTTD